MYILRSEEIKGSPFRKNTTNQGVIFLYMCFLPGCQRITIEDSGSSLTIYSEAFAYELNGTMYVYDAAEFYALADK